MTLGNLLSAVDLSAEKHPGLLPTDQESKLTQEIRSLLTFALGLAWKKPFLQHTSNLSQKTVPHCI